MSLLLRVLLSAGSAIGTGLVVVIALALVDMYLAGHGKPSFVHQPAGRFALGKSWGDLIFLGSALAAGVAAWFLSGKPG